MQNLNLINSTKMKYDYFCPTCLSPITVNNNIVLTIQRQSGESGIIFLDTIPGNYSKIKHSSFKTDKNELMKIFCPVCHKDLLCLPDKNLARLYMKDSDGDNLTVLFSVKYGEESTYIVKDKEIQSKYGKDSEDVDFESLSLCK